MLGCFSWGKFVLCKNHKLKIYNSLWDNEILADIKYKGMSGEITDLTANGKKYYVRVRTYKTVNKVSQLRSRLQRKNKR